MQGVDGHARPLVRIDDAAQAKAQPLHQRAVNFLGTGLQRHAQQHAAQAHISQAGTVAVPPVQADQPAFAGMQQRGAAGKLLMRGDVRILRGAKHFLRRAAIDKPA